MIKYKSKVRLLNNILFKPFSQSEYTNLTISQKTNLKNICRIEILYIFGVFFYLLSLKPINAIGMKCFSRKGVQCLFMIAKLILCSSLFFSISIFLTLIKSNKNIRLIYILLLYILFILLDHNNIIIKHGLYNFIGLVVMTIILPYFSNKIRFPSI